MVSNSTAIELVSKVPIRCAQVLEQPVLARQDCGVSTNHLKPSAVFFESAKMAFYQQCIKK